MGGSAVRREPGEKGRRGRQRRGGLRRREEEDRRHLEFAGAVRARFPGCPPGEELEIARYSLCKGTGRVGRVAVSEGYLDEAVELAVVSHIRHRFTCYERLLARGVKREEARELIREELSAVLRGWAGRAAGEAASWTLV